MKKCQVTICGRPESDCDCFSSSCVMKTLTILFHGVKRPVIMKYYYRGQLSKRLPSVILCSLPMSNRAAWQSYVWSICVIACLCLLICLSLNSLNRCCIFYQCFTRVCLVECSNILPNKVLCCWTEGT